MGDGTKREPDWNIYNALSDEPDLTPQQRIVRVLAVKEKAINDIVSSFNPALFLHNSFTDIYPYNIFNEYLDLNSTYTLTDLQVLLPNDLRLSNKSALHVIGQGCLQCHVALICASENISAEQARSIALEHKRKRGEHGAQIGRERNGSNHMSDIAREREIAWDIEDIIYMIELAGSFAKEGKVADWSYIATSIGIHNPPSVKEMYRYYRNKNFQNSLPNTNANILILEAFKMFGVYEPNPRFDWKSRTKRLLELKLQLQTDGQNKFLDELIRCLQNEDDEFDELVHSELELKGNLLQIKSRISRILREV